MGGMITVMSHHITRSSILCKQNSLSLVECDRICDYNKSFYCKTLIVIDCNHE